MRIRSIVSCVCAAAAGVYCFALPPYIVPGALEKRAYGWPLIPWVALAWSNVQILPTAACFFVLGVILGLAQPRT